MKLQGIVTATGELDIVKTNSDGVITDKTHISNLVVEVGKEFIAQRIKDNTTNVMSHMSVGSNNTTPVLGDSALNTELGRAALTSTTVTANTVTYVATFLPGVGTGGIVEAGIFNSSTAGAMLARTTFNVINKDVADTITVTWVITIS
jgi:hypothetical protein